MTAWSSAYIADLPDSAFACIDADGRHYPHHDASGALDLPHLRNALSRVNQAGTASCGKGHLEAHASARGVGKAWEMKAEPMTTGQLDRWLQGKIPRRHLAIPFGGPIPSKASPLGVDLDGEWFDEDTDLYGPFPTLRQSRERLVDWHHVTFGDRVDPTGVMKGGILGRIVMDPEPSEEEIEGETFAGVWADFWANAGEKRRQLVAMLERRAVPLYGSSQPIQAGVRTSKAGHIDVWPVRYHTITTSPQNTRAILPPMKAMLDDPYLAEVSVGALRAFLTGADNLGADLLPTSAQGEGEAKAGRVLSGVYETDIDEAVQTLLGAAERLRAVLARHRKEDT